MPWTVEQKLSALLKLPWTIEIVPADEGEDYIAARVAEIPDALATGSGNTRMKRERALGMDLWQSLRASLIARLEEGDTIPLPKSVSALPWDVNPEPPTPRSMSGQFTIRVTKRTWTTESHGSSTLVPA